MPFQNRDPNRIPIILARIAAVWEQHPQLRLFQLLLNPIPSELEEDLYYMEEDHVMKMVEEFYQNINIPVDPAKGKK